MTRAGKCAKNPFTIQCFRCRAGDCDDGGGEGGGRDRRPGYGGVRTPQPTVCPLVWC